MEEWDKKVTWRGEKGRQGKLSRKADKNQIMAAEAEQGWDQRDINVRTGRRQGIRQVWEWE